MVRVHKASLTSAGASLEEKPTRALSSVDIDWTSLVYVTKHT